MTNQYEKDVNKDSLCLLHADVKNIQEHEVFGPIAADIKQVRPKKTNKTVTKFF